MYKSISCILLLLIRAPTLMTGTTITLYPTSGSISGQPGDSVGWGFAMTADPTKWTSVTGSFLLSETAPGLGVYSDLIGFQGGPVNAILAPGSADWVETFDNAGSGLASFTIDALATPGQWNSAILRILFDEFSADPNTCGSCYVGSNFVDNAITVTASTPTPEPATSLLVGLGLAALLCGLWRQPQSV